MFLLHYSFVLHQSSSSFSRKDAGPLWFEVSYKPRKERGPPPPPFGNLSKGIFSPPHPHPLLNVQKSVSSNVNGYSHSRIWPRSWERLGTGNKLLGHYLAQRECVPPLSFGKNISGMCHWYSIMKTTLKYLTSAIWGSKSLFLVMYLTVTNLSFVPTIFNRRTPTVYYKLKKRTTNN